MKRWEKNDFTVCPACKRKGWYVAYIGQLHQALHCCRYCEARERQVVDEQGTISAEVVKR